MDLSPFVEEVYSMPLGKRLFFLNKGIVCLTSK